MIGEMESNKNFSLTNLIFLVFRKHSKTIEVALVTYDTNSLKCFGFCHIKKKEIIDVDELKPDGPKTATYDAYENCIQYLRREGFQGAQQRRIIVITDGGDNSSVSENLEKYKNLQLHLQKQNLMIRTILLHISTNDDGSKELAHALDWEYKQIRKANVHRVINSYLWDYPSEYTRMSIAERQKTIRCQARINNAPVPPTAPIFREHQKSKQTEKGKILVKEPILE